MRGVRQVVLRWAVQGVRTPAVAGVPSACQRRRAAMRRAAGGVVVRGCCWVLQAVRVGHQQRPSEISPVVDE